MGEYTLQAGAARRVITPPVGVSMSGWNPRATGDIQACYVRDELYAKALVLQRGDRAWALLAVDLTGVDAVATAQIRKGVAEETALAPEAIMICATHTHSGPANPQSPVSSPLGGGVVCTGQRRRKCTSVTTTGTMVYNPRWDYTGRSDVFGCVGYCGLFF